MSEDALFTVERTWEDSDFCHLANCEGVSVEGDLSEWKEVAEAIRAGKSIDFRRVACQKVNVGYRMWSPRNASDRDDYYFVGDTDIPALLASIDELEPLNQEKVK